MIRKRSLSKAIKHVVSPVYFMLLVPAARKLQLTHRWEDIYELAVPFLDPRKVAGIVDGGAFQGGHSLRLAKLFTGAKVHAFEPAPDAYLTLQDRVRNNRRIVPIQAALSDTDGIATLKLNKKRTTSSLLESCITDDVMAHASGNFTTQERIEIKTITLDNYIAKTPGFKCDFLKLDIQGYELRALKGAQKSLQNTIQAVVSEVRFTPFYFSDSLFYDIHEFLSSFGFGLIYLLGSKYHKTEGRLLEADVLWIKNRL
jgi:FkbM family methyltransferase